MDKTTLANHRPFSNLSFARKITKQVVAEQLQGLLDDSSALDVFQPGFWPGYDTKTSLAVLLDNVMSAFK